MWLCPIFFFCHSSSLQLVVLSSGVSSLVTSWQLWLQCSAALSTLLNSLHHIKFPSTPCVHSALSPGAGLPIPVLPIVQVKEFSFPSFTLCSVTLVQGGRNELCLGCSVQLSGLKGPTENQNDSVITGSLIKEGQRCERSPLFS